MRRIRTSCPRDCQDCCSLLASVDEKGRLVEVLGDPDHPLSRGYLCKKGYTYPELIYHPERLHHPQRKIRGEWQQISWNEALDFMVEKIQDITSRQGPEAILHFHYSGSESITKKVTKRFFGGLKTTGVEGDLCLSGGIRAQTYDFGGLEQSEPEDLKNARGCVIWGRNVPTTNLHLMPYLKEAQAQGMEILVINPLYTGLEEMASYNILPRPGTDAALALGACHHLIESKGVDHNFLREHTYGYQEFVQAVEEYTLEKVAEETGVDQKEIERLASFYVEKAPVTTLLGYGLQRYRGGGNSIRAIDALSALTGNIGREGAGPSYCSDTYWKVASHIEGEGLYSRLLHLPNLAEEILTANPSIELAFIHAANPLVNVPHTERMREALQSIETLVVSDMFLTDTAREADLILPCTSFFEEEGIRLSSWSPWIYYAPQVIEPVGESRPDEDVILELAERLHREEIPWKSREELLSWAIGPLEIGMDRIKEGHLRSPKAPTIAWKERRFRTPSGRFEFYSQRAREEGQSPVATYLPPRERESPYPLQLLSPHAASRIHSQFQVTEKMKRVNPKPLAYLHSETGEEYGLVEGDRIEIYNDQGTLSVEVAFRDEMRQDVLSLESGWHLSSGGCANILIKPGTTEMGGCATLYDTRVEIRKI